MGMGADEDDRSQTGRKAMVDQGCRDADGGAPRRAEGGSRARAQAQGCEEIAGETTSGKTTQAGVSAQRTRTKRADAGAAKDPGDCDPWGRDPARACGGPSVAQADLSGRQANQELAHQMPRERRQKTESEEQASTN